MTTATERPSGVTSEGPEAEPRPPYGFAALAALAVFILYALTLSPTTAFWDTSEYIATGYILGIPHPPGNPLFVVLARSWTVLLAWTGLPVAVRVNLFSAFMSAGAHGFWFLVVHHVLRSFSSNRTFRLVGAAASVMVSATAFTVWNQSNVNEKVYTVSLLTIALLSWLAVRWQERLGRGRDDNLLVLMAFILALSVGNHLMAFLAAPAIGVFILLVAPRVLLNWKLYPPVVVAALLGLSIHLFLPIRAELDPVVNQGAPECENLGSALESIATYGWKGCGPLSETLRREQYKIEGLPGPGLTQPRQSPPSAQFLMYLQYFDWQWARSAGRVDVGFGNSDPALFPPLRVLFTMIFTALGVWGLMEHQRSDRRSFAYMAVLFFTLSVGLVWYLNFKYGYSIPDPLNDFDMHEVRERDYFFIASFSVWGLWAGMGLVAIWRSLADRVGSLARAAPVLVVAAVPLVGNAGWASRAHNYAARDWAYNLLMSVEPYAVLFTNGDNDTFPLWYLQEVEGIRRDVTVIVTSYLNTGWYAKQLRDLSTPCPEPDAWAADPTRIICQRSYTAENTGGFYTDDEARARAAGKVPLLVSAPVHSPRKPIMELDDTTVDQVQGAYMQVDRTRSFDLGGVIATLQAGTIVYPWHQFALAIIHTSLDDRPIYFASSGNAAASLGLDAYLVRQGVAFKLDPDLPPDSASADVVAMPPDSPLVPLTGLWVDWPRTRALVDSVFVHRSGLPEWAYWPDAATIGIPNYYAWAYFGLAQAEVVRGDTAAMERDRELGNRWQTLGH